MLSTTGKCNFGIGQTSSRDYSSEYNPYALLYKDENADSEKVVYKEHWFEYTKQDGLPFRQLILRIGEFTQVEENKTQSDLELQYSIRKGGLFGIGAFNHYVTFYPDGYVDVETNNSKAQAHYYYQFDPEKGAALFEKAEFLYQEDLRIAIERAEEEERCNQEISTFDLNYITDKVKNANPLKIEFSYYKKPYKNTIYVDIVDNATLKEMILNLNYTDGLMNDFDYDDNRLIIESYEDKNYWRLTIDEAYEAAEMVRKITDKFGNNYQKKLYFGIDRTAIQNLFNKAIEIRNAIVDENENR